MIIQVPVQVVSRTIVLANAGIFAHNRWQHFVHPCVAGCRSNVPISTTAPGSPGTAFGQFYGRNLVCTLYNYFIITFVFDVQVSPFQTIRNGSDNKKGALRLIIKVGEASNARRACTRPPRSENRGTFRGHLSVTIPQVLERTIIGNHGLGSNT